MSRSVVIALWAAYGLANVVGAHTVMHLSGVPFSPWFFVRRELVASVLWILFTPLAVGVAQRFPLRGGQWRNHVVVALSIVVLSVLRAVAGGMAEQGFGSVPVSWAYVRLYVAVYTISNLYVFVLIAGAVNLVRVHRESIERQQEVFAAASRLARLEMNELHAHVRPDFLFLTLRGIGRVLHASPAAADRMIVDLGELLRRSLAAASREETLGESLEQLDRYVALHAAASETEMSLHLIVAADILPVRLPVVAVQPLVEAAVIHCVPRGGGRIHVSAGTDRDRLHVCVRGETRGGFVLAATPDGGGLQVLRVQLERLYASDFMLEVRRAASTFTARLEMPFQPIERTDP